MAEASKIIRFPSPDERGLYSGSPKKSDMEKLQDQIKDLAEVMKAVLSELTAVRQLLQNAPVPIDGENSFDEAEYRKVLESIDTDSFKHVKWDD